MNSIFTLLTIFDELYNIVLLQNAEKVNISWDVLQKRLFLLKQKWFRKSKKWILAETCDKNDDLGW